MMNQAVENSIYAIPLSFFVSLSPPIGLCLSSSVFLCLSLFPIGLRLSPSLSFFVSLSPPIGLCLSPSLSFFVSLSFLSVCVSPPLCLSLSLSLSPIGLCLSPSLSFFVSLSLSLSPICLCVSHPEVALVLMAEVSHQGLNELVLPAGEGL